MPLQEGPHLFLCTSCRVMYSTIPQKYRGEDEIVVTIYGGTLTLHYPKKDYEGSLRIK
jgi:hypothetical protein